MKGLMKAKPKLLKTRVFKASMWYIIASFLNQGIKFLTIPIFTNIMTVEEYGILGTYNSVLGILNIVLSLSLYSSIRNAYNDFQDKIDEYISSISIIAIINLIFVLVLGCVYSYISKNGLYLLAIIQAFSYTIYMFYNTKLVFELKYKKSCILTSIPNILSVILGVFSIIYICNSEKYLGRIVPNVIVNLSLAITLLIFIFKRGKVKLNKYYVKYSLAISIPLIFHAISVVILSSSDRLVINYFKGNKATGIYTFCYNFATILGVFIAALENIWLPWFNKRMNSKEENEINSVSKLYVLCFVFITSGIVYFSPEIMKVLAPKEYWGGISMIPIIVLGEYFRFLYTLPVNIEYFYKNTKSMAKVTLAIALLNLILNILFVPIWGASAAACTTLLSYLIFFVVHWRIANKLNCKAFNLKSIILLSTILVTLIIVFYFVYNNLVIRIIIFALFSAVCYYLSIYKYKINSLIMRG